MSMSEQIIEKKMPKINNEGNSLLIIDELRLINHQKEIETEYGANSQLPNLKEVFEALKGEFLRESFTINYTLIINITIITSVILSLWLLTLIGGIFNNFILMIGIVMIVLIFMIFESLSLLEKEINREKQEPSQNNK